MKIDRTFLTLLRRDIDAALASVAAKHNIKLSAGNARFTDATATFKLDVATIGDGGQVVDKFADDFKRLCVFYSLKPEHFGATFTQGGNTYKIVGLNRKAHGYPVLAERDGKRYKFAAEGLAARTNVGAMKEAA